MAIKNQGETVTYVANGDLSAHQYGFVYQDADNTVAKAVTATRKGLYVLQNEPASGFAAECVEDDESLLKVGVALSIGDIIMCSTGGLGIAATSGNQIAAIAREASTASGDIIRVKLTGGMTAT